MRLFTKKICSGINLSVIPSDKFKSGVITFSLTVPLSRCSSAYNNILSGILRRGTRKYPTMSELNRRLDELYGTYMEIKSNTLGKNLSLSFICEVLDNKFVPDNTDILSKVIAIVSEMIIDPIFIDDSFDDNIFEQEKRIILDDLDSEINNTRAYSIIRCKEMMLEKYKEYPTVSETKDIIKGATLNDIKNHYVSLISTSPLDVFYIGATDENIIENTLIKCFSEHKFPANRSFFPAFPVRREKFKEATEKMPVFQGKLSMCFSTGTCICKDNDSYYTALLLNEIFGGSASSKLFLNVREKMGLCYYCSSSFGHSGIITVSSGIEVKNYDLTRSAIIEQLEQIKRGSISDDELYFAKRSIQNSYKQLYDSPLDLQAFYSSRMIFGISDTLEDSRIKLDHVTKESIIELAQSTSLDALFFIEGSVISQADEGNCNE